MKGGVKAGSPEYVKLFTELIADPPPAIIDRAAAYAKRAVFQQEPGKALQWARQSHQLPGLRWLAVPTMPFIATPANVIKAGLEATPLGFAKTAWTSGRDQSQTAMRAALGSVMTACFADKALDGELTGSAPVSPAERDQFYREGKQPNAIKVGDAWVSYQAAGPLALQASAVANMVESVRRGSKVSIGEMVARTANSTLDQSYLSGLFSLVEAIDQPERRGEAWFGRTLGAAVPFSGAVRAVRNQVDDVVRDADSVAEHATSGLPGLSSQLPPRVDWAGEVIRRPRQSESPILDRVLRGLNPFTVSADHPDPTSQWLAAHGDALRDPDRAAGGARRALLDQASRLHALPALERAGIVRDGQLSEDAALRYKQAYGRVLHSVMTTLRESTQFNALPLVERQRGIDIAQNKAAAAVKKALLKSWLQSAAKP